jgi:kynurenine formamidase
MTNCIHDHARWGAGDQLGAGHLLTAETTLSALGSVRQGRIYDLSHVIEMGAPKIEPVQLPYVITSSATSANGIKRRRALGAENDAGSNLERIEMTTHIGTHIDALGHFTKGDDMYGGRSARDEVGDWGLENLGIEHAPPVVTRGVCVDVSGLDGNDSADVGLRPGDVLCVNTGWGRFFMTDNDRYVSGEPGIEIGAAEWLTGQDVAAICCDNMAIEVLPGTEHPKISMPVHQHALVEAGVYLVENLVTDALARDAVTTFCFIMLPTKYKGATGCPVRPVAVI